MFFYNESDSEVSQVNPPAPSDPYFYNTSLLLKMDSDFGDSSVHQHTATTGGNASVSNSEFKYDGGSGYFDGTAGTGVAIASSDALNLANIDWTMEAWINPDGDYSDYRMIFAKRTSVQPYDFQLFLEQNTGNILFYADGNSGTLQTTVVPSANQWSHIAVVRNSGTVTIYLNGQSVASSAYNVQYNNVPLGIGSVGSLDHVHRFKGHIDDVRITKGVARYTANFTPPDSHPTTGPSEIVSTDLQLHLDAGDTNSYPGTGTTWYDLSGNGNDAVLVSSPTFTTTVGGEFGSFGDYGSGGYVRIPHDSSIAPTSQITVEGWIYMDNWATPQGPWRGFISKTQTGGYSSGVNDGVLFVSVIIGGAYRAAQYTIPVGFSGWHHVLGTYDGTEVVLYLDGQRTGQSTSITGGIQYSVTNDLLIGREAGAGSTPQAGYDFPGKVAISRIYNRGLTAAEALQNFEATKTRFGL